MSNARENILAKLHERKASETAMPEYGLPEYGWSKLQKIEYLRKQMTAVQTEVHHLPDTHWIDWLNNELPKFGVRRILVGNNKTGNEFKHRADTGLQVDQYTEAINTWKMKLFETYDAAITTSQGGIAESGSLILWPTPEEPRLMSLVPPVHIVLLDSDNIFETFAQAIKSQQWVKHMPTNALLISGPSKTTDIEQTLIYGVHGPKRLIVLIT